MTLRSATMLLIAGSVYTVLHKAAYGLSPALGSSGPGATVTSILWLLATFTLILFAYAFLKDVHPPAPLRLPLTLIMVFTGFVIVSRLPFWSPDHGAQARRVLFGAAALLNSVALLFFVLALIRAVPVESSLRRPLQMLAWALAASIVLGLVSAGYTSHYLLTQQEVEPLPVLRPLAMLVFLLTYAATLWFLVRFRRLGSCADLVKQCMPDDTGPGRPRATPGTACRCRPPRDRERRF